MDRPKVPVHHELKKAYFVALREAWYAFDETALAKVKAALTSNGLTEADIEAKMYYSFDYFRKRVPRLILPPSKHYSRVRAVYEAYGPLRDSKTGVPLFNEQSFKRAKNVLEEIILGYAPATTTEL